MQRISPGALSDAFARVAGGAVRAVPASRLLALLTAAWLVSPPFASCPAYAQKSAQTPPPAPPAAPAKSTSNGAYTDRSGATHHWQITAAKALVWDGKPYLPVGGAFAPHSFLNETDAAWQEDVAALTTLKSKGLFDLIVWPGKPLPDVPAAAFQRLIDYLDANGFRYGLAFGPGLTAPLTGTIVKPAAYRFSDKDSVTATWQVPHADSGLVVQTDPDQDNKLLTAHSGQVAVQNGVVTVPIEMPQDTSKVVSILYPHAALPVTGNGDMPDLWAGFDDYRDRLLAYLGQVKLGSGLRFFLDPLARHIGLLNESDYVVPDSANFRLEWEGYLARRYPNVEEMRFAWSLNEGDFKTHQELARLIPLWANGRGIPYFFDPLTHKFFRILDAEQSRWWRDFLQCRNDSILYYLNSMANVLKRQVADVPVVVTWTESHPIFCNTDTEGGYDGLGIAAGGIALIARVAGPAYSEAEQAARTIWCVATEVAGAQAAEPGPGAQTKTAALQTGAAPAGLGGYASQRYLDADLDSLRSVGIKGFFASGFQTNPDDAVRGVSDWLRHPETLDWLRDYGAQLDRSEAARYSPQILFFPQNAPGPARIGPVPGESGVLWMDSFYPGETQDWWPAYSGYTIQQARDGDIETVLVSLQGKRETHLWVPDAKQVKAFRPDGTPVPLRSAGKTGVVVTLDETPTVFHTGGQRLVPQEAAADVLVQLSALMAYAHSQKILSADNEQFALDRAEYAYRQRDYDTAYSFARSSLDKLTLDAKPYIWLEGESTPYHTFTEVAPNAMASSGAYLRLSTPNPPGRLPYGAFYLFDVPTEGRYDIWVAGTPPGPGTSPIQWRINQDPPQAPAESTPRGLLYLNDHFGWFKLGTVTLKKGDTQRLTIYVTDRAQSPPDYSFSVDAILLTPQPFTPNGRVRPLPMGQETVRAIMRDKRLFKP